MRVPEIRLPERMQGSPWTNEQRAAVLTEADRILADPSFIKSRRCVVLFRRLIEHALGGGDEDGIKERTLGIEVFGRAADYDTNTDPIVRMTANEIRKRLAQYYQSTNRHHEVYINLVPGNYLPRFDFGLRVVSPGSGAESTSEPIELSDTTVEMSAPELVDSEAPAGPSDRKLRRRTMSAILVLLCALGVAGALALNWTNWTARFRSSQDLLWSPLLRTPGPVTICVADLLPTEYKDQDWAQVLASMIAGHPPPTMRVDETANPSTPFVDAEVSARLAAWIDAHGKPFKVMRSSTVTLENFRREPVVVIGAFDNFWNLTLLSNLRYHVQIDAVTKEEWIEDRQNLAMRDWKGSGNLRYSDASTDYALITRVFNPDTRNWILAAGGLGMHGTEAAGDLLSDPELSQILPDAVRSGKKNFQIVLKTTVISGHTGAPQIIAVHTW
jgi:hypothetical protein